MSLSPISDSVLVMDVGNTNIVCAVYQNGKITWQDRISSLENHTAEDFYKIVNDSMLGCKFEDLKYVVLGSVVPKVGQTLQHMVDDHSNARLFNINGLSPLGLRINSLHPDKVGADLVANAFATWQKYHQNAIVIDLGTATTIQLVTADGLYQGVAILPGLKTAAQNLFLSAAQLDEIALIPPKSTLGNNTIDAMTSGIVLGHALMIDGFIDRIIQENSDLDPLKVLLTGGLAGLIKDLIHHDAILDSQLTTDGLYLALLKLIGD